MEQVRFSSLRGPAPSSGVHVLRASRGEQPGRDNGVGQAGQAALELVNQLATTITENERRSESLIERAVRHMEAAEERIRTLEARAVAAENRAATAEARAADAEAWVQRLHQELRDKFAVRQPRQGARTAAA